jgi:AraC family transcriptional regulator, exoenzyme S synthesis regulatory protein ExsA
MENIFKDGRLVLVSGNDIQMVHYEQRQAAEKSCLQLETNILSFVLHGKKWLYHARGKMEIGPGEGFFLSRGNYLRTERTREEGYPFASLVISLSDGYLRSFAGYPSGIAGHSSGIAGHPSGIAEAFGPEQPRAGELSVAWLGQDALPGDVVQQLVRYFSMPEEKSRIESVLPLKIRELLLLLASAPANRGLGAVLRRDAAAAENPLQELMEAHFRESLRLEQWAFLACLSLSSFKRKFETLYNMPPGKWIQQRRLQEAHTLLRDPTRNVTGVCFEVGFENLAHFVHAFKERYGVTPKQLQLRETLAI